MSGSLWSSERWCGGLIFERLGHKSNRHWDTHAGPDQHHHQPRVLLPEFAEPYVEFEFILKDATEDTYPGQNDDHTPCETKQHFFAHQRVPLEC